MYIKVEFVVEVEDDKAEEAMVELQQWFASDDSWETQQGIPYYIIAEDVVVKPAFE